MLEVAASVMEGQKRKRVLPGHFESERAGRPRKCGQLMRMALEFVDIVLLISRQFSYEAHGLGLVS